jgi:hypothetical protein
MTRSAAYRPQLAIFALGTTMRLSGQLVDPRHPRFIVIVDRVPSPYRPWKLPHAKLTVFVAAANSSFAFGWRSFPMGFLDPDDWAAFVVPGEV